MKTTATAMLINEFVHSHLHGLQFTKPEELPRVPLVWICEHFQGMELHALLSTHIGLVGRGANASDCARYTFDSQVELPFAGCERFLYDAMIAGMRERGYDQAMIARIFELTAVIADGAVRLLGLPHSLDSMTALADEEAAHA